MDDKKFDKGAEKSWGDKGGGGKDAKGGYTPEGMKPVGQVKDAKPVGTKVPGKG
jgi:hypothetical protein